MDFTLKKFKVNKTLNHTPRFIAIFNLFFQQYLRNYKIRLLINKFMVYFIHKFHFSNEKHLIFVKELEKNGYSFIDGLLNSMQIDLLKERIKVLPCTNPWNKDMGEFFYDNPPAGVHVGSIKNIISIPEVIEIANNPQILNIVAAYLGCKPTIDNVQAWWSFPGNDKAEEAENYHRDNDAIRFVKLFIYLTDVDEESGPHKYIEQSHCSNILNQKSRMDDDLVENTYGNDKVKVFTGAKGLSFLEDTWGIHKGQLPKSKLRLLLQIRYTSIPSIFVSRESVVLSKQDKKSFDSYINRYIIQTED
ncbi:hypothetical protein [Runella limosa]|uniref:hypothetical protein n=1 Tax=Runella limosa TaxID=370978 RepID=UPI000424C9FC|nr:hypothetical protein [Runella limosa]